jgi:hypothetical protein
MPGTLGALLSVYASLHICYSLSLTSSDGYLQLYVVLHGIDKGVAFLYGALFKRSFRFLPMK